MLCFSVLQANEPAGRKSVQIKGANGQPILTLMKSMPAEFRQRMVDVARASNPEWKDMSLGQAGREGFEAEHFSVWNRYAERVRSYRVSCFLNLPSATG